MNIDLLLLRHGEAVPYGREEDDPKRALTERGQEMARKMSQFVQNTGLPLPQLVITSGFLRAEETRKAIVSWSRDHQLQVQSRSVEPMASPSLVIEFLSEEIAKLRCSETLKANQDLCVALVGHNPCLGELRTCLLDGREWVSPSFQLCELTWMKGTWKDGGQGFEDMRIQKNVESSKI